MEEHKEEIKTAEKEEVKKVEIVKEEEVAIDFSKIKNIFKRKEKHHVHHKHEHSDFEKEHKPKRNEAMSAWDFIKKHRSFFLILIPLFICIFIRLYPAYLPVADQWANNNVESYYKSQISEQINQRYPNLPDANKNVLIAEEWNKFKVQNKDEIKTQTEGTAQQLRAQFQDENGQTYLLAIDPWFWYRNARNYMENGYDRDVEVNGRYFDNHRLAPLLEEDTQEGGSARSFNNLLPWMEVVFYKVWSVFNKDLTLLKVSFFMPMFISVLSIIPAYFLIRKVAGDIGALVGSIVLAANPFTLTRTVSGFSDTDAFNLIFPLMIFWMVVLTIEEKSLWKSIVYSAIGGLSVGLYSFAWSGWTFTVNFAVLIILGVIAFRIVKEILRRKKFTISFQRIKQPLIAFALFLVFGAIFTGVFGTFNEFAGAGEGLVYFIQLKDVATKDIWPNVFTTVAELNPGDIGNIVSTVGGKLFLFMGLFGIMLSFYINKKINLKDIYILIGSFLWFIFIIYMQDSFSTIKWFLAFLAVPIIVKYIFIAFIEDEKYNVVYPTLLFIYLFGTMFSISRGVRFSLLVAPAFALCFGVFIGIAIKRISNILEEKLNLHKAISYGVLIILTALILIQPVQSSKQVAFGEVPSINDQWVDALESIKEDSQEDAIINSWWDFGHWFKAIADRGVTLDGGGQDKPQAHWLGKLMLAKTEEESVGVLRLLVCGKNFPYDRLFEVLNGDGVKAKKIVDEIILVDKEEARKMLEGYNIPNKDIEYILSRTHCDPPEDYFITSEDMVSKAGVWGHFGSWDFTRASMYNKVKRMKKDKGIALLQEELGLEEADAKKYYTEIQTTPADQWISPWPGYLTSRPSTCNKNEEGLILCPVPVQGSPLLMIDIENKDAYIKTQDGKARVNSLAIPTKDGVEIVDYNDNLIGYSATLIPGDSNDSTYSILYSHPLHAGSMFTRLFFMEGHGMTHFEKFYDIRDISGQRIIVWKVDWEGKQINNPYENFFE